MTTFHVVPVNPAAPDPGNVNGYPQIRTGVITTQSDDQSTGPDLPPRIWARPSVEPQQPIVQQFWLGVA